MIIFLRKPGAVTETFGTMGEASQGINGTRRFHHGLQFTPSINGTVTQARCDFGEANGGDYKAEIWSDSSNRPGSKIGNSSDTVVPATGEATFTWSSAAPSLTSGTTYWLVLNFNGATGSALDTVTEVVGVVTGSSDVITSIDPGDNVDSGEDLRLGLTIQA
jgi:hypothetical protein